MAPTKENATKRPPGEGERAARRGYVHQDRASARLIYEALATRHLRWIGLADRSAGVADDLVLGLNDSVRAYQFKRTAQPKPVGLTALLLGEDGVISDLATAYHQLGREFPGTTVRLRYLTNDYPSTSDRLIPGDRRATTAAFLEEWTACRERTVAHWRASRWAPVMERLLAESGLADAEFEQFWTNFELVVGASATPFLDPNADKDREAQIEALARCISTLVADNSSKDRWTRAEILTAVGWPDRFALRFPHSFPVGAYVQRNEVTEARLANAITAHRHGYISLVGPPGTGKSTLLQRELRDRPKVHVVRYLAFVPGAAQGQGRGEADSFYDDVNSQLAATGLEALRVKDDSTRARQQAFEHLLAGAGRRFERDGVRYVIVVDGLDHIPREEQPDRSLLAALPLPPSVPDGVTFVLGTQRLDLVDMPPAVREEAGVIGRRIEIAPLSQRAVATIADVLGLPPEISREEVYRLSDGHPLMTRYLVERLISSAPALREKLFAGEYGFGGDIQSVYEAAWRGIERADHSDAVKQVVALLARAEGPIEPELLAREISDEAVETALREAGHLLNRSTLGWRMFHNSFRLFVHRKPILRFGTPDPRFVPKALYRRLADLSCEASQGSPQRWLRFRYLYLAGAIDEALALADRDCFVRQYCDGRSASAVQGDVSDALRALTSRSDPVKLFDLMLASEEVGRRATVMEGAASLIDANLAVGDIDAARAALSDPHEDGKQWLVVDALLRAGEIEQARGIFEDQKPFPSDPHSNASFRSARDWVERAILFLDETQLEKFLSGNFAAEAQPRRESDSEQDEDDLVSSAKFEIARALAREHLERNLEDIAQRWLNGPDEIMVLILERAEAAFERGQYEVAHELLQQAWAAHERLGELHPSWPLRGARLAARLGAQELGANFLAHAPLEGLRSAEKGYHRSEQLVPVCRALVTGVAVRAALGIEEPVLGRPDDRLLRGLQHHLVELGLAIGAARAGNPSGGPEVKRLSSAAMHFLASARVGRDEDWFTSHLMPRAAEVIGEAIFSLLELSGASAAEVARLVDGLIEQDKALFRFWPGFRRLVALRTFDLDDDAEAALGRLEGGLADMNELDPREEIQERTAYATAIAKVGARERAKEILAELRGLALGAFAPAKKDGQYHMWTGVLAQANAAEPAGRAARATTALRLVDGLERTQGYDTARRIARQMLFEAAAADPVTAWSAAKWAASTGAASWDGIVDATLRGVLLRSSVPSDAVLIAWARLCMPWYGEPWGSTTYEGQFLRDLITTAAQGDVAWLESDAVCQVSALAPPDTKPVLLSVLQEAASARGGGELASAALARWKAVPSRSGDQSYSHLTDLAGVAQAVRGELSDRENRDMGTETDEGFSYELSRAAARVIAISDWREVSQFAKAQPELCADHRIKMALARVAVAAGEFEAARALFEPIADVNAEGWAWPSSPGRLRYHQVRHLLGESDAFELARADFIADIARLPYGISTVLWKAEEIFPLLFEEVPWSELWQRLEAQIRTMRDYRMGREIPAVTGPQDDEALVAAMFIWALTLGVPLLHAEAARGAAELLRVRKEKIFVAIVEHLLAAGGEAAMLGADLLTDHVEDHRLAAHFRGRVQMLADDPDAGVAAAASFLAERWGLPVSVERRDLPSFYQLHFPEQDADVRGKALVDGQTRGMIIEDPLGWTEGWESFAELLAEKAGLPALQVRRRVAQLIHSWGGVGAYGHSASKELESELKRIALQMPYRRPQAAAALRALRHVLGEAWRSGRISTADWRLLLLKLRVYPDKAVLPEPLARPERLCVTSIPRLTFANEQEAWLSAVAQDTDEGHNGAHDGVLAEWRRSIVRETRITATSEKWRAIAHTERAFANLEQLVEDLPEVVHIGQPITLYGPDEIHPSRTAVLDAHILEGEPTDFLLLCPRTASQLGWSADPKAIHIYRDADGQEMARTTWWRDGLPQPVNVDERRSEGQRVVLSDLGSRAFAVMFGVPELTTWAWRRVEIASGDGVSRTTFAGDAVGVNPAH